MSARRTLAIALAAVGIGVAATPATALRAGRPSGGRLQLDVRSGQHTPVPAGVQSARRTLVRRLGIEGHVSTDPVGGGIRVLDRTDGFLSGPRAGDAAAVALAWVRANADVFGLTGMQIHALRLVDRSTSNDGVTHLTWVPVSDGVPAYDSALRVHVTRDGRVIAASGPPLGGLSIPSATPQLSASQALGAAQNDVGAPPALPRAVTGAGMQRPTRFVNGDRASLVAFQSPSGDRLAWRLTVAGQGPYLYDEVIDASSGQVLARHSLTDFAVSDADVYPYHPDAAAGGSAVQVDIAPWLTDPSGSTLTGPNAHAYADVNGNDQDDGGEDIRPSSGTDWIYPLQPVAAGIGVDCSPWSFCTWGGTGATLGTETTNRAQATTQLFYLVNTFHDWLAGPPFDFTSSSGSFDSGDPLHPDPLHAEADDAILSDGFVNNANMSTPPDGTSPTMRMYLWTSPAPAVNGSDDASIVFHEYTHGLSNRLIGNGDGLDAKQSGAMGEGWSDWYAMDYLADPSHNYVGDTPADGEVIVGEYATGDTLHGIRNQPLDCSVGSTAPACGGSTFAGHTGGFTYADLGHVGGDGPGFPSFEVHDDGEIWSETLWDIRKALGPQTARTIITDGMRLSPLNPSFLDERDAIIQADLVDFRGADHDLLWKLFAARGMGYGASTPSANATSATASFAATPLVETASAIDDSAPLGDGDGVAEPGEALRVRVTLHDPSPAALTNVAATLTTASPGVVVGVPSASYGTIAAGGSAQDATPFAVTITSSAQCGAEVALTLHVTSDQGAVDLPVEIPLGSGGDSVFATPSQLALTIPDGDPTLPAVSTLTVPTAGRIHHLRVTMSVTHTSVGDLRARLTSPSGTTIDLFQRPGPGDFGSTIAWSAAPVTFDDAAGASIQDILDTPNPLSGTFAPDDPLSRFDGEPRAGTWTLQVSDASFDGAPASERMLNSWSLETDAPSCSTSATLPAATTGAATGVSATAATLGGSIDAAGSATAYRFDYGTTTAYGQTTADLSAGSASGAAPQSASVAGLSPATTYHFRIVALRDGIPVMLGADGTFATAAPGSGGGGTDGASGGGSAAGGSSSGSTGGGPAAQSPGGSSTAVGRPHVASPTGRTGKATLDAHRAFAFAFRATARLRGTIRFTISKHGRTRAISFGSRSFAVSSGGRVKLSIKVGGSALAQLRKRHSVNVTVTIVLGGRTFTSRIRLTAPKPRPRR